MDHGPVPCLFCQIIAGDVASVGFYEDSHTVGIMDLRQPGWPHVAHVLVLPREHVEEIDSLSHRSATTLMSSVVTVAKALRSVCRPEGISVWQSNGEAAGQEVPHVHVHLLPLNSMADADFGKKIKISQEELASLAEKIRSNVEVNQ